MSAAWNFDSRIPEIHRWQLVFSDKDDEFTNKVQELEDLRVVFNDWMDMWTSWVVSSHLVSSSAAYPGQGHRGSSFSRDAMTLLCGPLPTTPLGGSQGVPKPAARCHEEDVFQLNHEKDPTQIVYNLTHHFHSAEDMTEVVAALQILGDVSKSAEVIWVLSSAWDVPDLMLCNYGLMDKDRKWALTGNPLLMDLQKVKWAVYVGQIDKHRETYCIFPLPSWLHQWTWLLCT